MMHQVRRPAALVLATVTAVGVALLSAVSASAGTGVAGGAQAPAALSGWGTAQEVPGIATLNQGGAATLNSVSCRSAGNCSAGGLYHDASQHQQAFVVSQISGTWQTAKEVPGTATLNKDGYAQVWSVSCGSAGNCGAGGYYTDGSGLTQVFVVSQISGTWQTAKEVPGSATLNQGGNAFFWSVSCASAGNCSAGGAYTDSSGHEQAFVVSEVSGTWQSAKEVPGTATLNKGGGAYIDSVSCASAGNCSAGGAYTDSSGHGQAFVVSQSNGTWNAAKEIPGTATLNKGGGADVQSVSCASAGNCSAGGYYNSGSVLQAFVVSQISGTWQTAKEVPGTGTLNHDSAEVQSVSCASAGNCSAGGYYTDSSGHQQAFVASQTSGTWQSAKEIPGTGTLNKGGFASAYSVSCASAGNCSIGGYYWDAASHTQVFVDNETSGTWQTAEQVPGTATLDQGGNAYIDSVSCASAASCSAGGWYSNSSGKQQAFVINET